MDFKHSITKRIVIVFALMIEFVAVMFVAGLVATFHGVYRQAPSGCRCSVELMDNIKAP